MTICVRVRLSNTTVDCESPTLMSLRLTVTSPLLVDRTFGPHADHARCHHELAGGRVAELGHALGELQLAAAFALLLPGVALLLRPGELHTWPHRLVVLEVLLGVQTATSAPSTTAAGAHPARRLATGPEPRLGRIGSQRMLGIELPARHR